MAGDKGLHMNFVFVADVADDAEVVPNHEFSVHRWVDREAFERLSSPINVRQFGYLALDAVPVAAVPVVGPGGAPAP